MTLVTQHIDTLTTELMRLNFMAQEVNVSLQSQAKLLNIRNISLPQDVLADTTVLSETLQQLAEQVDDEQIELAQLRALTSTASLINSSLEWEEVITRAMDIVIGLTDAERGYIMLQDEVTGQWETIVARNMDKTAIEEADQAVSQSVVDTVIRTGEPVLTSNAQEDTRFKFEESILKYEMRSIICVPLVYQQEVSGVIYVDNLFQMGSFGERELRLVAAFANQAAIAIENARLFEQVRAQIDEVAEMRQFLDNVFASIVSGVITTDSDGHIITFSPSAEDILDLDAGEVIGQQIVDVLPALYEGFEHVLETVQEQGTVEVIEISTVLPGRGPSFLKLKLSPLRDEDDNTFGVAIAVDDLTDIKRRDETINVVQTYLPPAMVSNIDSIDSIGLGGEERIITAMFADVRGFTSFSEHLEPEEVMAIINQYLSLGAEAITDYEGIIDKYMGDAIVGLFNTQLNMHEDHALRAVKTALETRQGVLSLHSSLPKEQCLSYGIGIHTGVAMLGNVGSPSRKEFTVLGEALVVSKKLQEIAQPGEIIISEATYDKVSDIVEAEFVERPTRSGDATLRAYIVHDLL